MNTHTINYDTLQALAGGQSLVSDYLRYLLESRVNNREIVTVSRSRLTLSRFIGYEVRRREMLHVFRQLAEAGCGVLRLGRNGHPSRFIWQHPMREVAQSVYDELYLNDSDQLLPLELERAIDASEEEDQGSLNHSFYLRPDLDLEFQLPADLSEQEADRIGFLVHAHAFPKQQVVGLELAFHEITLPLRADFLIALDLPTNLTRGEAQRIERFLSSLPFDNGMDWDEEDWTETDDEMVTQESQDEQTTH